MQLEQSQYKCGTSDYPQGLATKRRKMSEDREVTTLYTETPSEEKPKKEWGFSVKQFKAIRAKTEEEIAFLEAQFKLDPTWSRKTVQACKKALNLKTSQIYKWGYDKKKRLEGDTVKSSGQRLGRNSDKSSNNLSYSEVDTVLNLNSMVTNLIEQLEREENLVRDYNTSSTPKNRKDFCPERTPDDDLLQELYSSLDPCALNDFSQEANDYLLGNETTNKEEQEYNYKSNNLSDFDYFKPENLFFGEEEPIFAESNNFYINEEVQSDLLNMFRTN